MLKKPLPFPARVFFISGQYGGSKRRKEDIILKKRKLTFHELVEKNKEELLRDDHVLAKIEERLAEKHEQALRASS